MLKRKSIILILAISAALLLGLRAYATTLTVTSAEDDANPGTLRNIIRAANPGDTIMFAPFLSGSTIFLSASRQSLIIDKTLSIDGNKLIAVHARRGLFSVFKVTNGAFSVSGLTITGSGYSPDVIAGGIYCSPGTELTVTDCQIVDNHAFQSGGIFAQGPLTMTRTTISNNHAFSSPTGAGGVCVNGNGNTPVRITDCTISANSGINGGLELRSGVNGIISQTVIDKNTTKSYDSPGGAVSTYDSHIVFEDSFITSNTGFTGLSTSDRVSSADSHHVTLINTEISDNGPVVPGHTHVSLKTHNCFVSISNCRLLRNRGIFAAQIEGQPKQATISDTTIDNNRGVGLNHPAVEISTDAIALNNCRITNNRGGGIRNGRGYMRLKRCLVKGNTAINWPGGGIINGGTLAIDESTIADNTCASDKYEDGGGGIATLALYEGGANLTLNNSTVSGNRVITTGNGGGIYAANSPFVNYLPLAVTLNNCTISGNSTSNGKGGGIYFNSETGRSSLTLTSSTITRNQALGANGRGGGVFSELRPTAIVLVDNTIVAGNTDAKRYSPDFWGYVNTDRGYNLIGESDGSDGWSTSTLIGTIAEPINPVLGNLVDNGGPTPTHALLTGSPAIGTGNPQFIGQRDQRGVTRNNPNDIGAYYSGGRSSPSSNSNAGGK